jgi:polyisoprenoid-binding protein YceI
VHATLRRSDFGMNYGIPLIGDEVNLAIEVEGFRE